MGGLFHGLGEVHAIIMRLGVVHGCGFGYRSGSRGVA